MLCTNLSHPIYPALHGKRLSYRRLVSHGGFVYPGPGLKHASFKRQESIPQIHFPPAFLLAARGTMQSGMFVYKCGPGKCMTHVNSHMHGSHTVWPESFSDLINCKDL